MKLTILLSFLIALNTLLPAQESYIVFGKGGGFSGVSNVYKVYRTGEVQKGSGLLEIVYSGLGKIKKNKAKKLFAKLEEIETDPFSQPGNTYYFISYLHNGMEIKYTWGSTNFETPEELNTLYVETVVLLSQLTYKPIKNN